MEVGVTYFSSPDGERRQRGDTEPAEVGGRAGKRERRRL